MTQFWPIWTCFKIDSLDANHYCIENLPHIGRQDSHLTICYYHQDLYWCTIQTRSLSVSFTSIVPFREHIVHHTNLQTGKYNIISPPCCRLYVTYTCSAINFQGYCICSVSCYTLLSRFQLPWPLPECLYTTTLFMVSNNECTILAHLKRCFRFIPHHLFCLPKEVHKEKIVFDERRCFYSIHLPFRTHLKFDNKSREFLSRIF